MSRKQRMPLSEFLRRFGTNESCRDYLAAQRWPQGFVCPKCGHKHGCRLSNGLYQCTHCHHQTSVTAGTVLHHSHVNLSKWFLAFYFVSQDKRGISAVQLSEQIGVTYGLLKGITTINYMFYRHFLLKTSQTQHRNTSLHHSVQT